MKMFSPNLLHLGPGEGKLEASRAGWVPLKCEVLGDGRTDDLQGSALHAHH